MKRSILISLCLLVTATLWSGPKSIAGIEKEIKTILKTVSPSIVKVVAQDRKKYIATGISLDKKHIVTSILFAQNPQRPIYVETISGHKYPAKIVGKDVITGILVLEVESGVLKPIARADSCEVGDWIALVGTFYKEFPAIFQGILSSASGETILLNAPVAPGSTGGAVVDKKGALIGVVRGRFSFAVGPDYTFRNHDGEIFVKRDRSSSKNLAVAVPVERIEKVAQELIRFGKIRRSWLGVSLSEFGDHVEIGKVYPGSPAEKAGIRVGDILVKIDREKISIAEDIAKSLRRYKPRDKIELTVQRNNTEATLEVVLGEAKPRRLPGRGKAVTPYTYRFSAPQKQANLIPEWKGRLPKLENYVFNLSGSRTLGIDIVPITPELAEKYKMKEKGGLLVTRVYEDTAAYKGGLQVADIIVAANGKTTNALAGLKKVLNGLGDKEEVKIDFYRDGKIKRAGFVPDRGENLGSIFDSFQGRLKKLNIEIDDADVKKIKELIEIEKNKIHIGKSGEDRKHLEEYERKIRVLTRERDQYYKQAQELLQQLREEQRKKRQRENNLL